MTGLSMRRALAAAGLLALSVGGAGAGPGGATIAAAVGPSVSAVLHAAGVLPPVERALVAGVLPPVE
jgi:hypothetical protein